MPVDGLGFATRQIHAGAEPDTSHGARATPIYLTAGFVFDDFDQANERFAQADDGYSYSRAGNPTSAAVERRIADLEGGADALLVGSGQAAVSTAVLALVGAGDHIVSSNSIYEGSRELFRDNFARLGITTSFVGDANDPAAWEAAIRPETRVLFAESIPNPKNDILDIRAVATVAQRHGIPLIIDNTLATPYLLRPIEHGADIVVHSASKFLAGHGTVLGGVIVDAGRIDWAQTDGRYPHLANDPGPDGRTFADRFGRAAFSAYARSVVALRQGPSPSPFTAFLLLQGIETLSLRVQRHSESAKRIAEWLEEHPAVESVDYSGLASNPYRALAETYLPRGQGSVFAFTLRGGRDAAKTFTNSVRLFTRMTHLGDVRSLALHPASTTHVNRTEEERIAAGIGQGLLRVSIGLEDVEDLIADLDRALAAVQAADLLERAGIA
ncbi:O-acetylhomoserine (thiol)-lyase [Microbacterium sp. SLBN-154]|uniref:O-acetylhomoserine aminocarboxypropyltransferase/cysteine synthase family protein n=1 Tax=Microbacterium sp. SLBN-154 TaxID=2768458 RepID=UPI00114D513C|nr:O-acetylhomoserine aminocarboxypropyltransferase/cysteine synthase family protein [Microbacterium sp. SLBN-154]TQK17627.1 O-acetylhomoserine (thiol)-lyase [Microbacterium sp. SLBN-154]